MTEYIAIVEGKAGEELIAAIDTNVVPITSAVPTMRHFVEGEKQVFILAHQRLSPGEYEKFMTYMKSKFTFWQDGRKLPMPRDYIERRLNQVGYPLLAADCAVQIFEPPSVIS